MYVRVVCVCDVSACSVCVMRLSAVRIPNVCARGAVGLSHSSGEKIAFTAFYRLVSSTKRDQNNNKKNSEPFHAQECVGTHTHTHTHTHRVSLEHHSVGYPFCAYAGWCDHVPRYVRRKGRFYCCRCVLCVGRVQYHALHGLFGPHWPEGVQCVQCAVCMCMT